MNRELKFRAWHKVAGEMYQNVVIADGKALRRSFFATDINTKFSDELLIMQYTGLKDKNDREIYEGDIVKAVYKDSEGDGWYSEKKVQGKVYFDTHWGVKFDCQDGTQRVSESWIKVSERHCSHVEVIGNIYENPELLK